MPPNKMTINTLPQELIENLVVFPYQNITLMLVNRFFCGVVRAARGRWQKQNDTCFKLCRYKMNVSYNLKFVLGWEGCCARWKISGTVGVKKKVYKVLNVSESSIHISKDVWLNLERHDPYLSVHFLQNDEIFIFTEIVPCMFSEFL